MIVDFSNDEAQLAANLLNNQKTAAEKTADTASSALNKIVDASRKNAEENALENVEGPA
jgi:hypothetical protein